MSIIIRKKSVKSDRGSILAGVIISLAVVMLTITLILSSVSSVVCEHREYAQRLTKDLIIDDVISRALCADNEEDIGYIVGDAYKAYGFAVSMDDTKCLTGATDSCTVVNVLENDSVIFTFSIEVKDGVREIVRVEELQ